MQRTVVEVFEQTARTHPNLPALMVKRSGDWKAIVWAEYRDLVRRAARGMIALGLPAKGTVAILGDNRPEWFIADLAAITAGGVASGIYATSSAEQCHYVCHHCEATLAVVEDGEQLAKLLAVRARLPALRAIVLMAGGSAQPDVYGWQDLLAAAERVPETLLEERVAAQRPGDLCTLIYTSGTTAAPKAVMLSHHNITWTVERVLDTVELEVGEGVLSYLPLSHIAEQVVTLHAPIAAGACTWFAESLERLGDNLREVRPAAFLGVPRVWEKMQAKIVAAGAQASPIKRRLAAWARRLALAARYAEQRGGRPPWLYPLARRLVLRKIHQRLGFDRTRYCITSAAPISLSTLEFFLSLDLPLLEVYGMSECTGPATTSLPLRYCTGKAGFALSGGELAIAEDGEILIRGAHVFLGYFKDEAASREAVDEDGWLHSGDIGEIDERGFLTVTDRKKELLITSGGKNIAPQLIEGRLKSIPGVAQAVALGDRRKFVAALLTLDAEQLPALAEVVGSAAQDAAAAASCPRFQSYLEQRIAELNRGLTRAEAVKQFCVLPGELTVESGELTPTMKLKRRIIAERYATEIEALYAEG